mgnify:CR=1 FL=1
MSFSEILHRAGRSSPAVISIIITLAGLIASQVLPIAQYPGDRAADGRPSPRRYPGASAETLARTVAAPIEEQLSGVENLIYFSSTPSSNGALTITCTFEVGTDANKAVIDVNNRVAIALPRLPDDVRRTGVVAQKRSTDILLVVALTLERPALRHAVPVELRDDQRARRAEARSRRGRRDASSARATTRCASGCSPTKMAQLGVTTDRRRRTRSARRTTSTPPARSAQEPAPAGPVARLHGHGARPADRAGGIRQHRSALERPRRRAAHHATSRASSSARSSYDAFTNRRRQADDRHRRLPAVGRQRAQGRRFGAREHGPSSSRTSRRA